MFVVYVTHPQVVIDPAVPIPDWGLSALGRARAEEAAQLPWARSLARVVTSAERKAHETGAFLARTAGVEPEVWPDLHENDRSATGYLPPQEFEATADAFFSEPTRSIRGSRRRAIRRRRLRRRSGTG